MPFLGNMGSNLQSQEMKSCRRPWAPHYCGGQNGQNAYISFKTNMIILLHCSTFRHYTCFHTPPQHSPQCVSSICPVPPSSSIQVCRPSSQTESNHLNCKYIWYLVTKLVSSGFLVPNVHFNLKLFPNSPGFCTMYFKQHQAAVSTWPFLFWDLWCH